MSTFSLDLNEFRMAAQAARDSGEDCTPVEIEAPSQGFNKLGEHEAFMLGFEQRMSKAENKPYYVILVSKEANPTNEKAVKGLMFSLTNKTGQIAAFNVQNFIKKLTGELLPMNIVNRVGVNGVGGLLESLCHGPCKVRVFHKKPYFTQQERGVVVLMDPKTNDIHTRGRYDNGEVIVFGSFDEANAWAKTSQFEGGIADIPIASFPEVEFVGPGDAWEMPDKAREVIDFLKNPEVPVEVKPPQAPAAAPNQPQAAGAPKKAPWMNK